MRLRVLATLRDNNREKRRAKRRRFGGVYTQFGQDSKQDIRN